ncbi:MAG: hypothetical protein CMK59_09225 [Proteobacteria bacterium]|nr:hypothetical protein [Pseudomonadota bacterium]
MIFFLLSQNSAFALGECSTPYANVMLRNRLSAANEALEAGDLQSMHNHLESINLSLSCLIQPLDTMLAVKYHMLMGAESWLNQQTDASSNHFAAVKQLYPTSEIPAKWLPDDEQLRAFFEDVVPSEEIKTHSPPENATYYFDGQPNNEQPLYRPSLYQFVIDDRALQTVLISPGALLPNTPGPLSKTEATSILSEDEMDASLSSGNPNETLGAGEQPNESRFSFKPTISGPPFSNNIYITSGLVLGAMSLSRAKIARSATKKYNDNTAVETEKQLELLGELETVRTQSMWLSTVYGLAGLGLSTYGILQWEW